MPSSTSLLETDEGESEVPPPLVHAFAGMGLDEQHGTQSQTPEQADESLSFHHHHHHQLPSVSHFSVIGTVLDLKPLPLHRPPSGDEVTLKISAAPEDKEPEVPAPGDSSCCTTSSLLVQAHRLQHLPSGPSSSLRPSGIEPPHAEPVLLYSGEELDGGGGALPPVSMAMLPSVFSEPGYDAEHSMLNRRKSVNTTECVAVPSSEHVAEIVGRQGELTSLERFGLRWIRNKRSVAEGSLEQTCWWMVRAENIKQNSKCCKTMSDYKRQSWSGTAKLWASWTCW